MLPGNRADSELKAGREASGSELRFRLSSAGIEYLQGAFLNSAFGEEHLPLVLGNPNLTSGLIQKIAAEKKWLARYEVQRGIVFHSHSPRPLRMSLLHFLRWRDLARLSDDPQCPPPIKHAAEGLQISRVGQMAVGEKISLARIASPSLIAVLGAEANPDVVAALMMNPRITEEQVIAICLQERIAPTALAAVAATDRWAGRYPVRVALLRNPATPPAVSTQFLDSLLDADLREIAGAAGLSRLLRATARQILRLRTDSVDRKGAVS